MVAGLIAVLALKWRSSRSWSARLSGSNMCSNVVHDGVMAGGMNKRGSWGTMAERVAVAARAAPEGASASVPAGTAPDEPRDPTSPEPASPEECLARLRHCWVVDGHGRLPGLLLGWRRTEAGFQGRVVHPVHEPGMGWVVVEEWLPAGLREPA